MSIHTRLNLSDNAAWAAWEAQLDQLTVDELVEEANRVIDMQLSPELSYAITQADVNEVRQILSQTHVSDLAKSEALLSIANSSFDPVTIRELISLLVEAGVSEVAKFDASKIIRKKYETSEDKTKYILALQLLASKKSALWTATRAQDIASIKLLFSGPQKQEPMENMWLVLRDAIATRSVPIVREFVKHGIYPELTDNESETMNLCLLKDVLRDGPIENHEEEIKVLLKRRSASGQQKILDFLRNEVPRETGQQIALIGIKSCITYLTNFFPDRSYQDKLPAMPENVCTALREGDADTLTKLVDAGIDEYTTYQGLLFVVKSSLASVTKIGLVQAFLTADAEIFEEAKKELVQIVKQQCQDAQDPQERENLELIVLLLGCEF